MKSHKDSRNAANPLYDDFLEITGEVFMPAGSIAIPGTTLVIAHYQGVPESA